MLAREITSLQHTIVKHLVKLRKSSAYRYSSRSLLISGNKLVRELAAHCPFLTLLALKNTPLPLCQAEKVFWTTPEVLKKVTGLVQPEELAAEIPLPPEANLSGKKYLIALDGIADPGNLGTLLRTALALGWEGVFITTASSDPFNEKALRAAKGATFRLPIAQGSVADLEQLIVKNQMHAYIADSSGTPLNQQKKSLPVLLILGNEAHGATKALKRHYAQVSIPMEGQTESLNVAAAGAILMYHFKSHG